MSFQAILFLGLLAFSVHIQRSYSSPSSLSYSTGSVPEVTTKNGTYAGYHNAHYKQDFFLGIPYAQPPLGQLRLDTPQSLNCSFEGVRQATAYYPSCVGYGGDDIGYETSEDCLALNIIRPAGTSSSSKLPIAAWYHGGGYVMGGGSDRRYNLSFIVQNSVDMGKPIIGISINYRLSGWGFLAGKEMQAAGLANLGLKDQRLALHWLKENVAAFGGDPSKITIWGESAGGGSVGYQAYAYGGSKDQGLFRGIIAESLYESGNQANISVSEAKFNNITVAAGCASASNKIACLRGVSYDVLNKALNVTPSYAFYPVVDGDFLPDKPSVLLKAGKFSKVPLLIGTNSDEGTSFSPQGINTTAQFSAALARIGADANTTAIIEELYPDIPSLGIPQTFMTRPSGAVGSQFKRTAAFFGDYVMFAPRRLRNQAWFKYGAKSYAYRFNVIVNGIPEPFAVTHFQEVAFVFDNTNGLGYATNPFAKEPKSFPALAQLMSRMWVSFAHDLDPNNHGIRNIPHWPIYNDTNGYGQDFVFDANVTSHPEYDTYRLAGTSFINEVAATQFGL